MAPRLSVGFLTTSALLLLCANLLPARSQSPKDNDLITHPLPGLNFAYSAKQYSGYFHLSSRNNIHYWFLESQSQPTEDPLILWISGGPGCSSLEGLFTTVGPFYPNPDGESLFENVYSWNKLGNMLFLDSPRDAGFSYRDPDAEPLSGHSDDAIATDNAESVQEFLKRFPEYAGRTFYIVGESYGGIFTPSLVVKIIPLIQNKQLNLNLAGIAIGNGLLSVKEDINSFINLAFYRGIIGVSDMNYFRDNCCVGIDVLQSCDFSQYVSVNPNGAVITPNYTDTYPWDDCADKIVAIIKGDVYDVYLGSKLRGYNIMNTNVDCYSPRGHNFTREVELMTQVARTKEAMSLLKSDTAAEDSIITDGLGRFADLGSLYNTLSTDPFGAFPCYSMRATQHYLNSSALRQAIGIPSTLDGKDFKLCEYILHRGYIMNYTDTAPLFERIIDSGYPLSILIYSGDSDMLINFLSASNFVHSLPIDQLANMGRSPWLYQSHDYMPMTVGYYERFSKRAVTLDLVTVASAGHMAPQDSPGPTMQMIANFMTPERNYSRAVAASAYANNAPTLRSVPPAEKMSRKQADKVHSLPGLTFPINFNHYSGYLGGESVFLHYWLVESQSNPANDPLVLWLNGGPGCSSLVGLLSENGPFHANPDGKTLYENPHSWNKVANVLYLESPVGVGYSYRGEWPFPYDYEDHNIADTTLGALLDFFDAYPEYNNRPFYVAGESYGGIYIPMLAQVLVRGIKSGQIRAKALPSFSMPSADNFTAKDLAALVSALIVPSDPNNHVAVSQINGVGRALIEFYANDSDEITGLDAGTIKRSDDNTSHFYYKQYTRMLSDAEFIIPALWEARAKSQRRWPVAIHHFDYISPNLVGQLPYPAVSHTTDLAYTIDIFYVFAWEWNADDSVVRSYSANLYVNFIKNGMGSLEWSPIDYPPNGRCDQGARHYTAMNIRLEPFVEDCDSAGSVSDRLDFWDRLARTYDLNLVKSLPDTMGECEQQK